MRAPGGGSLVSRGPLPQRFFAPDPAETGQRYSKQLSLTVLLRSQVRNYSLTGLWLIWVAGMASAIQQGARLGRRTSGRHCPG